jgi:hypothetical protein
MAFSITGDGEFYCCAPDHVAALVHRYVQSHLLETTVVGSGDVSGEIQAVTIVVAMRKQSACGFATHDTVAHQSPVFAWSCCRAALPGWRRHALH